MATGLPTSVAYEIELTAGVWTDITTSVRGRSVSIVRGRSSKSGDAQPGTLDLDLDNSSGTFMPDNPLSSLYPNFTEGKRIRVRVTKGSPYTRFLARIREITPDFPSNASRSTTHIQALDRLGDLQAITLRSPLEMQVLSEPSLVAYFPLGEPSGALEATNLAESSSVPISPLAPSQIGSGGTVVFGDATGPTSDGLSAPTFTRGSATTGTILSSTTEVDLGLATSMSLEAWFSTSSPAPAGTVNSIDFVRLARKRNAIPAVDGYFYIELYSDHIAAPYTDTIYAGQMFPGGLGPSLGITAGNPVDGGVHHGVYTESYAAGVVTCNFYLDGVAQGAPQTYTVGASFPRLSPTRIVLGGSSTGMFTGAISHVAVYNSALTAAQVLDHYRAGSPAPTGDTLDAQLARLATWTGAPLALSGTSGKAAFLPATAGKSAFDILMQIARGESGIAYHEPATDTVRVPLASSVNLSTVALTIDAAADLEGTPTMSRDNIGRVARATAQTPVAIVVATDATLVGSIGAADVAIDATLANRNELYALASSAIAQGRDQRMRLSKVTIDLSTATNDLYSAVFNLTPGQRVRLSGLLSTFFGVTWIDGYYEGMTEEPSVDGYVVTLDLSPADAPIEGVFDTSRFAFGDGVCTASALTPSGTSATLTWTPTLPSKLSAATSGFEDLTTGGWVPALNCTAGNAAGGHTGSRSLLVASVAAGTCAVQTPQDFVYPVTAGATYLFTGWVFKAIARSCRLDVAWLNTAGGIISTSLGTAASSGTSVWTQLANTAVAPAGAVAAVLVAYFLTTGGAVETGAWDDFDLRELVTLSTSAGDYPLDLNINGERVTVSSAPATVTSPVTVTIIRGVAPTVARAHLAGEPVEIWDADTFAS